MPELKQLSVDKLVKDFNEGHGTTEEDLMSGSDGLAYMTDHELATRARKIFRRRDSRNETRGAGFSVSRGTKNLNDLQHTEGSDGGRTQKLAARLMAYRRQQYEPNRDLQLQ